MSRPESCTGRTEGDIVAIAHPMNVKDSTLKEVQMVVEVSISPWF